MVSLSMRKYIKRSTLVVAVVYLFTTTAKASTIRELLVDSSKMQVIHLKIGQSTVLRFLEKPKKVVIGNQNYFNVEFIDNDLTLQPQGIASTNLFVYGEYHTYGFLIKVCAQCDSDDLVKVRWKSNQRFETSKKELVSKSRANDVSIKALLPNQLQVELKKVTLDSDRGLYFLDFLLKNISKSELAIQQVFIQYSLKGKFVPPIQHIVEKDKIGVGEQIRLRAFVESKDTQPTQWQFRIKNKSVKLLVPRKYL